MKRKKFLQLGAECGLMICIASALPADLFAAGKTETDAQCGHAALHSKKQAMQYFYLRLNPPRASFGQDMTPAERKIMTEHAAYWKKLMNEGYVVVFGPVIDPKGVYGVGIIKVDNAAAVDEMIKNDPANGLNSYEHYPIMAVVPEPHS